MICFYKAVDVDKAQEASSTGREIVEKILLAMEKSKITNKKIYAVTGLPRKGVEWNIAKLREKTY